MTYLTTVVHVGSPCREVHLVWSGGSVPLGFETSIPDWTCPPMKDFQVTWGAMCERTSQGHQGSSVEENLGYGSLLGQEEGTLVVGFLPLEHRNEANWHTGH